MNKKEILEIVTKFAQTTGMDTPAAFRHYIAARKGEISNLKEKIKKEKVKVKRLDDRIKLAEDAQNDFLIDVAQKASERHKKAMS